MDRAYWVFTIFWVGGFRIGLDVRPIRRVWRCCSVWMVRVWSVFEYKSSIYSSTESLNPCVKKDSHNLCVS